MVEIYVRELIGAAFLNTKGIVHPLNKIRGQVSHKGCKESLYLLLRYREVRMGCKVVLKGYTESAPLI